ncbi:class I SAM-dependent methyltransferase [Acuticoccus kandeliae]|uniref:class I SAM-dependent methyltransferase n=1 Tax=Acuticoccus kandeliae TaxID=2073160 RepID=UPI000D3E6DE6|nr:class I SAM-dependent methyltransferase [Acuticoccus kandeliae]
MGDIAPATMLAESLVKSLGCPAHSPLDRAAELKGLRSQTSPFEREALYALGRYAYSGAGDIWDIGCAGGGSSYCLAAGVADGEAAEKAGRVVCFDRFDGHAKKAFTSLAEEADDLAIFHRQTAPVAAIVKPVRLDLLKDLASFPAPRGVEIAHIDAAKSLALWKAIFAKLAANIIPGRTVWIWQDFNRARLPFQAYALPLLLEHGEIIGGAKDCTPFLRFREEIAPATVRKIAADAFTLEERIANVRATFAMLDRDFSELFARRETLSRDLAEASVAYCHLIAGDFDGAVRAYEAVGAAFRARKASRIYERELHGGEAERRRVLGE